MKANEPQRAILATIQVGTDLLADIRSERSLTELESLASECNIETVGTIIQKREAPDRSYWLGKGKLEEMAEMAAVLDADILIFDTELSPTQVRRIEDLVSMEIVDRSLIIFEIFARRAKTDEGKIQVELAQLRYRLTRLTGRGEELSRLGGGIGTRGPGETQLETDRRHIMRRISLLRREMVKISTRRSRTREQRSTREIATVAVVGYTNSGKSTIVNTLCDADIEAENRLFMTLDPTARRLVTKQGLSLILIDTVGFIRDLPRYLLDAFAATLEEVSEADYIMQVTDISDPDYEQQIMIVEQQLLKLGSASKPRLHVLNKIDQAMDDNWKVLLHQKQDRDQKTIAASAIEGTGMAEVREALCALAERNAVEFSVVISYEEAGLVNYIQERGVIDELAYNEEGIFVRGRIPVSMSGPLKSYL
ncbi:MAG TPA: GTPase HflX [Clostridiaceae bacterium]|nr:GTPase HflX [Clostridiaceae bacterium]